MRNFYLRNPHGFDRWLKANAILGSLLAIGMLAMALAGLNVSSFTLTRFVQKSAFDTVVL